MIDFIALAMFATFAVLTTFTILFATFFVATIIATITTSS